MLVPLGFRIPEDVFLGMGFKTLLESPCRDDEFGPIPVDQGDEGTAFGAKLFGKPFGFGQFVTLINSCPESQRMFSGSVKILEAWADPVERRQRMQWQK